jgi:hypothetical protein
MGRSTTYQKSRKHKSHALKAVHITLDGDEVRGLSAREFRDFLYRMGDSLKQRQKRCKAPPRA